MTLIERLEAAQEGSRELDAEIWIKTAPSRDLYIKRTLARDIIGAGGDAVDCPHFSTSIDAALTLVLEGWYWFVDARFGSSMPQGAFSAPGFMQNFMRRAPPPQPSPSASPHCGHGRRAMAGEREIAQNIVDDACLPVAMASVAAAVRDSIEAALRTARAEALEEAAVIAENSWFDKKSGLAKRFARATGCIIAAAIREAKEARDE